MCVKILDSVKEVTLKTKTKCSIYDLDTHRFLDRSFLARSGTKFIYRQDGIRIGEQGFSAKNIRIAPAKKKCLNVNGVLYRGDIDLIEDGGSLLVVNRVFLEDYLKGVLPREVHHFWPFSALKAQAIASRSYALFKIQHSENGKYDLTADTYSQVYGGRSSERWRTSKAVDGTKGMVLEYDGKVLPAYFHSCCGGYTRDASPRWGDQPAPLKSVKCQWCRWSPYFRWQVKIPTKEITEKLNDSGIPVKKIIDIKEGERDKSQRLADIRVRTRHEWFEIPVRDFRAALGKRLIKSDNFRIKKYPRFYLFGGYGWGHGVGMCQWGAFGLSIRFWKAERILKYYYPGAEIVKMKELELSR